MNHAESLGAKQLFTPLRFRCQQVFLSHESFFAAPPGQLVDAKETYVSFSNPRQELFCHPGKFPSPSPLRTWPVRWRERLYAPFRPHRQAFSRKKFYGLKTVNENFFHNASVLFPFVTLKMAHVHADVPSQSVNAPFNAAQALPFGIVPPPFSGRGQHARYPVLLRCRALLFSLLQGHCRKETACPVSGPENTWTWIVLLSFPVAILSAHKDCLTPLE